MSGVTSKNLPPGGKNSIRVLCERGMPRAEAFRGASARGPLGGAMEIPFPYFDPLHAVKSTGRPSQSLYANRGPALELKENRLTSKRTA
jgi:hypothetical protein